jgi:hypothetical protein
VRVEPAIEVSYVGTGESGMEAAHTPAGDREACIVRLAQRFPTPAAALTSFLVEYDESTRAGNGSAIGDQFTRTTYGHADPREQT